MPEISRYGWLPTKLPCCQLEKINSEYAKNVLQLLKKCDIRTLFDERSEKIGKKIREAEISKIPYMLVIGDKEIAEGKLRFASTAKETREL